MRRFQWQLLLNSVYQEFASLEKQWQSFFLMKFFYLWINIIVWYFKEALEILSLFPYEKKIYHNTAGFFHRKGPEQLKEPTKSLPSLSFYIRITFRDIQHTAGWVWGTEIEFEPWVSVIRTPICSCLGPVLFSLSGSMQGKSTTVCSQFSDSSLGVLAFRAGLWSALR